MSNSLVAGLLSDAIVSVTAAEDCNKTVVLFDREMSQVQLIRQKAVRFILAVYMPWQSAPKRNLP